MHRTPKYVILYTLMSLETEFIAIFNMYSLNMRRSCFILDNLDKNRAETIGHASLIHEAQGEIDDQV